MDYMEMQFPDDVRDARVRSGRNISDAERWLSMAAGVGLTALWLRDFWSYDARTDEHAEAERAVRRAAGET